MFTLTYSPLKADGHFVHHGHYGGQDEANGTRTTADKRAESCEKKLKLVGRASDCQIRAQNAKRLLQEGLKGPQ